MTRLNKGLVYTLALIPWSLILFIVISKWHIEYVCDHQSKSGYENLYYVKLERIYDTILDPLLILLIFSIACSVILFLILIAKKKIYLYKRELIIMLLGHLACICVLASSFFTSSLD